jgi:hypothetical protein
VRGINEDHWKTDYIHPNSLKQEQVIEREAHVCYRARTLL